MQMFLGLASKITDKNSNKSNTFNPIPVVSYKILETGPFCISSCITCLLNKVSLYTLLWSAIQYSIIGSEVSLFFGSLNPPCRDHHKWMQWSRRVKWHFSSTIHFRRRISSRSLWGGLEFFGTADWGIRNNNKQSVCSLNNNFLISSTKKRQDPSNQNKHFHILEQKSVSFLDRLVSEDNLFLFMQSIFSLIYLCLFREDKFASVLLLL